MKRDLYAVLKQDIKTRRTELISVHWYCFEAEHIADIEFNSLCLDEQAKYNYLVCGVRFRNMCYQKGDSPRECFDRSSAAPVNKYCSYYTVYKVFSLKGLKKK